MWRGCVVRDTSNQKTLYLVTSFLGKLDPGESFAWHALIALKWRERRKWTERTQSDWRYVILVVEISSWLRRQAQRKVYHFTSRRLRTHNSRSVRSGHNNLWVDFYHWFHQKNIGWTVMLLASFYITWCVYIKQLFTSASVNIVEYNQLTYGVFEYFIKYPSQNTVNFNSVSSTF